MNSRSRLLLTLLLGLTAGACASSGGTSTTGTPNNTTEPQGRTFRPGTEPARYKCTLSAAVYLDQA